MHRRKQDYAFFKQLQPSVFKIMDGGPPDYAWAKDNLPNSLVIARDWALSEQKADMFKDPVGTGIRHAREWDKHQKHLGFDRSKTLILGVNEPQVWDPGVPEALRRYTIAMCDEATELGLRVGAMQLSVGWPANTGPATPPDWSPYHGIDNAIRKNHGALILHEYWADSGPTEMWGWWGGRSLKCPWQVPIIIGETGIDMFVKDGSVAHNQRGWRSRKEPQQYANELAEYVSLMSADKRFAGCCVFAADFANHEWWSFDIEPAYAAILATTIPDPTPPDPELPKPPPDDKRIVHPLLGAPITQHWGQALEDYSGWALWGHNGVDFASAAGTPVKSMAFGIVAYSAYDENGYGHYVRVAHDALGCYAFYGHLQEPGVMAGTVLQAGEPLGKVGSSGNSTGPHLHFEIRLQNVDGTYKTGTPQRNGRVDPETWAILHGLQL
jgi:murein DD-endopeptidase MepM/ murein hydrolase activator NlpD